MRKRIEREVAACDECGNDESCYYKCMECSKDMCFECVNKKAGGVRYSPDGYAHGAGEGFWCTPCDATLRSSRNNAVHAAYVALAELVSDFEHANKQFRIDKDEAVRALQVAQAKAAKKKK